MLHDTLRNRNILGIKFIRRQSLGRNDISHLRQGLAISFCAVNITSKP